MTDNSKYLLVCFFVPLLLAYDFLEERDTSTKFSS